MTDAQAQEVYQNARSYLASPEGQGFDVGTEEHFEALVRHVKEQSHNVEQQDLEEDDLHVVTAMCLLGPNSLPPVTMRQELLENILRTLVPNAHERLKRVREFAIAYGCGKWRNAQEGQGSWEQPWPGAMQELTRTLELPVKEARWWLAKRHIVSFPPPGDLWCDAELLARRLVCPEHPLHLQLDETLRITHSQKGTEIVVDSTQGYSLKTVLPGAKAVWTVTAGAAELMLSEGQTSVLPVEAKIIVTALDEKTCIETPSDSKPSKSKRFQLDHTATVKPREAVTLAVWECACGTAGCRKNHLLAAWNPHQVSLRAFVASAVKGPLPIKTRSFAAGMYFPLLAEGPSLRLRLVPVEYELCAAKNCTAKYKGSYCPRCQHPFDPATTRKVSPKRLILVTDPPGYQQRERLRCKNRRKEHYHKLTSNVPPDPLGEEWDNLYDLPTDWQGWDTVQEARELQRSNKRLQKVAQNRGVNEQALKQRIQEMLNALRCPLCGKKASQRRTIVWVPTPFIVQSLEALQDRKFLEDGEDDEGEEDQGSEDEENDD